MKGFITVMCILAVMIVSFFFYQTNLQNLSFDMISHIEKVEESVRNNKWKNVDEEMKQLTKMWDTVSVQYGMTIGHEELDLIMLSLFRADEYRAYREEPEFMAEIINLKKLVDHIPNKEKLSLENIF